MRSNRSIPGNGAKIWSG